MNRAQDPRPVGRQEELALEDAKKTTKISVWKFFGPSLNRRSV
jgi:hypothetical protein